MGRRTPRLSRTGFLNPVYRKTPVQYGGRTGPVPKFLQASAVEASEAVSTAGAFQFCAGIVLIKSGILWERGY